MENNFNQTLQGNLQEEVRLLGDKIKKVRESGNSAEYKNLVQAYKEIVDLYMDIKEDLEKNEVVTFNVGDIIKPRRGMTRLNLTYKFEVLQTKENESIVKIIDVEPELLKRGIGDILKFKNNYFELAEDQNLEYYKFVFDKTVNLDDLLDILKYTIGNQIVTFNPLFEKYLKKIEYTNTKVDIR